MPEPGGIVILPAITGPVPRLTGLTFETVWSSVLTSAIQYSQPCAVVAVICPAPLLTGGIEPMLIHCRGAWSAVRLNLVVCHTGCVVPDTSLSYEVCSLLFLSKMTVEGKSTGLFAFHVKSVAGPRLYHFNWLPFVGPKSESQLAA